MFDFEKLEVYQFVKESNTNTFRFVNSHKEIDAFIIKQWKKASMSIMTNLAEGTGRMTIEDKKHYLTIARGSVFECAAILQSQHDLGLVDNEQYESLYEGYERISKMLLGMYRSYN